MVVYSLSPSLCSHMYMHVAFNYINKANYNSTLLIQMCDPGTLLYSQHRSHPHTEH